MGAQKVNLIDDLLNQLGKSEEIDYDKPIATITDATESIRLYNKRFRFGEITDEEFDARLKACIIRQGMTVDEVRQYFPPDEYSEMSYNRTAFVRAVLKEARRLAGKDRIVTDVITNRNLYYSHLMYTCRALGDTDKEAIINTLNDVLVDLIESAELDDKVSKVKLFRSIFRGRDDVYSCKSVIIKQPLTGAAILRHLEGRQRLSIYPLLPNDTTFFAAVNIDKPDLQAVRAYLDAAHTYGIPTYLETSRSGGHRLWVFFTEPVPAAEARELVKQILRDADLQETAQVFPRQAELPSPENAVEYISPPLFGEDVRNGRTVFLNEESKPYADQWGLLASVEKITPQRLQEIIKLNHTGPCATGKEAIQKKTTAVTQEWQNFYTGRLTEKVEQRREIEDQKENIRADTRKLEEVLMILAKKVDEGLEERYKNLVIEPIKQKQGRLSEKMSEIEAESKRLDADVICLTTALEKLRGYVEVH